MEIKTQPSKHSFSSDKNKVSTTVLDFNVEQDSEEDQVQAANAMVSEDIEVVKKAFDYFAQLTSNMGIPEGTVIVLIQRNLLNLFSCEDCDPFIFECAVKIIDKIGSYFTDEFDGCVAIAKMWGALPNSSVFEAIASLLNKSRTQEFVINGELSPSLAEMMEIENIDFNTGALRLFSVIVKNSNNPELISGISPIIFNIAKQSEVPTIRAQCFEMLSDIALLRSDFLFSELGEGLFAAYESYDEISLIAGVRLAASLISIFTDRIPELLEGTGALPMIVHGLEVSSLTQRASITALFSIFSLLHEGAQMIFDCEAVPILLALNSPDVEFNVRYSAFRLLCDICVTLDDPQRLAFIDSGFIDALIENISSSKSFQQIEIFAAFISILTTLIANQRTEELAQISKCDNIYETLNTIESDDKTVNMLAERILAILQSIDE